MAGELHIKHPEYVKRSPQWVKTREAIEGGDAVRANAAAYLPKLTDQTAEEYEAYYSRPAFFEATGRTAEGLSGLVFSRPMALELPPVLETARSNVDLRGTTIEDFARKLVDETLATARGLIVVNHNGNPNNPGTALNPSGRPFLSFYPAESIYDWRTRTVNGAVELSWIKLRETETRVSSDGFTSYTTEVFRVLSIESGIYTQQTFTENTKTGEIIAGPIATPRLNGGAWATIPAVLISFSDTFAIDKSPLLPVAETNLSHWRTMADLEHGAHYCGVPTPYVTGVRLADNETIRLGGSSALIFEAPDAKVGFLEFTGQGLGALERIADRKEAHMASLGGQMLASPKKAAESGDALSIRRGGETSSLMRVSLAVSLAYTRALQLMAIWSGADPQAANVKLNTQFVDERLSAQEIAAVVGAWQSGAMSKETAIYNLQRGGRVAENISVADEIERIENEGQALGLNGNG